MPAAIEASRWLVLISLSILLVIASAIDVRHRRIPNWAVLAVVALFVPWAIISSQVSVLSSLEAAAVSFLMSCPLYIFRVVGAGDSKLLTATALFVGASQLIQFLFFVALAGGILAIVSIAMRYAENFMILPYRGLRADRGIPYGVAISAAAIGVVGWPITRSAFG
jgi:prepilin peptidase CpaA